MTFADMCTQTHTQTCLMALCPGPPRWSGTRKVKASRTLLKQETVSGSGISWAVCKSAPHSTQFFYRPDAIPATQPTASKHWRLTYAIKQNLNNNNYWELDYKIHRFQQTTLSKLHRAKVKWCKCVKRVVLRPADWNKTWMWITAVSPSAKVEKYQNTISGNSSHWSSISTRKVWLPISVPQRL